MNSAALPTSPARTPDLWAQPSPRSRPLRGAVPPTSAIRQSASAPAAFLRACAGPGQQQPATQSEGLHTRVANNIFHTVEAVDRASHRPVTVCEGGWAIAPGKALCGEGPPKMADRFYYGPSDLRNLHRHRRNFISRHLSQFPSRIFSSQTVGAPRQ